MITPKLRADWKKMTDYQRWTWTAANKENIVVVLGDDSTYIVDVDQEVRYTGAKLEFEWSVGVTPGTVELLESLGIAVEI